MNREFFITIPNEFYNDTNISNEELVVYTLLKRNYIQVKEVGITSINMLLKYMHIENRNPRTTKVIKEAIKSLLEKKIIIDTLNFQYEHIEFDTIGNNDLFYIQIEPTLDNYFCVFDYHLDIIFEYLHKKNIDKFGFTRYFISINRVVSNQSCFGFLTQTSVRKLIGENKTITDYNKILQDELKLIRYNNNYMTSERHYTSSFFGWYDDKENFDFQLKNEVSAKGLIPTDKKNSNKKRSITQKENISKKKIQKSNDELEIQKLKAQIEQLKAEKQKLEYNPQKEETIAEPKFIESENNYIDDQKEMNNKKEYNPLKELELMMSGNSLTSEEIENKTKNNPLKEISFLMNGSNLTPKEMAKKFFGDN